MSQLDDIFKIEVERANADITYMREQFELANNELNSFIVRQYAYELAGDKEASSRAMRSAIAVRPIRDNSLADLEEAISLKRLILTLQGQAREDSALSKKVEDALQNS